MSVATSINGFGFGIVIGAALGVGYPFIPYFEKIILALSVVFTAGALALGNHGGEVASSSWYLLGVIGGTMVGAELVQTITDA